MMLAFLLNNDLVSRLILFCFFLLLCIFFRRKINFVVTFAIMTGIVFFNVLVPHGELLFYIGPLAVTRGALELGIYRAITLQGLFFLSRFSIRSDLKLPGSFGEITGESLRIFSRLTERKNLFSLKNWVERLDDFLINKKKPQRKLSYTEREESNPNLPLCSSVSSVVKTMLPGRIALITITILTWLPLIIKNYR